MNNSKVVRNLEIIAAFEDLITYFKQHDVYDRFRAELEFLVIQHLVVAGMTRVALSKGAQKKILLADMQYYVARMNKGSEIYFSGFYESDLPMIKAEAERLGLHYVSHRVEKEWTAAMFRL